MANTKRSGGLGRGAFFNQTGIELTSSEASSSAVSAAPAAEQPAKPAKVRTTVTLYPATLSAMEQLKVELRKSGKKVTLSDVLEEAIHSLMEKKGLSL